MQTVEAWDCQGGAGKTSALTSECGSPPAVIARSGSACVLFNRPDQRGMAVFLALGTTVMLPPLG